MLSVTVSRNVVFSTEDLYDLLSHGFDFLSWGYPRSGKDALLRVCEGDADAVVFVKVTDSYPGTSVRVADAATLKLTLAAIAKEEPARFDRLVNGEYDVFDADILLQRWLLNGVFFV